ncbi:MAG: hypothetical protein CL593_10265 [Alteromonas sp.]|nr:hypothetical protein [Alteromonas sp.]
MNLKYTLLLCGMCYPLPVYANPTPDCDIEKNTKITAQAPASLLPCFASPSPAIRDDYALTTFSHILRTGQVSEAALVSMILDIQEQLRNPRIKQYHKAFLTLGLAEIARVDRITPFLNESQRKALVETAVFLFKTTTDFTGFDDKYGYIHQIPHTADLVLQLALNERISQHQLIALAQSLKTVINPSQVVFYHTNEPDRLARASIYLFLRKELSEAFITQWLEDVSLPPNGSWEAAYQSKKGLAAMHNVKGFLGRLLLTSYDKQNERIALVHAHALAQLRRVR